MKFNPLAPIALFSLLFLPAGAALAKKKSKRSAEVQVLSADDDFEPMARKKKKVKVSDEAGEASSDDTVPKKKKAKVVEETDPEAAEASAVEEVPIRKSRKDYEAEELVSRDLREQRKFGLGLHTGFITLPAFGFGADVLYNATANVQIEASLGIGTFDAKSLVDPFGITTIDKFDINIMLAQARLKYFFGNSFYAALGLGLRTIEADFAAHTETESSTGNMKVNSVVGTFGIGNVWTLDSGFYIGAEWLGVASPLSSSYSYRFTYTDAANTDLNQVNEDASSSAKDLGELTSYHGLLLYLGFQF